MILEESNGEVQVKLVYLGAEPRLCQAHLEHIHAGLAPGLASELRRLIGDGQILSRANELMLFDFAPVARVAAGQEGRLRLRLHLWALGAPPTETDLAFLLKGVEAMLFVRAAGAVGEAALYDAAQRIMGGPAPIGCRALDESHGPVGPSSVLPASWPEVRTNVTTGAGVLDALKLVTSEFLRSINDASRP